VLDRTAKKQLAILLATGFAVQMGVGMIIVGLPIFATSIGLGTAGVGLLIAVPQLSKLLMNLPAGYLVDTRGRKPSLVWGALIDALGHIATALSTGFASLIPARLIVGVGSATGSAVGPAATAYTYDVVGKYPDHSGLLLGLVQASGFLAFAVGPALGGVLAERGAALPFLVLGALQLATVPFKMLLPETMPPEQRDEGEAGLAGLQAASSGLFESYRKLLADRQQVALLCMKCSFLCGLSLILTVVPLHATAAWGASPKDLGTLYSFVTLLCLVASPIAGVLADRVGRTSLAIGGSIGTALAVAAMPYATSKLGYASRSRFTYDLSEVYLWSRRGLLMVSARFTYDGGHSSHRYYVGRSVWSVSEAFLITAYSALALDVTPEAQRGARNSLDSQAGDVALLFLPLLFGVVGQKSHRAAFWLASGLMLAANLVIVRLLH
jgi:MFS family permease